MKNGQPLICNYCVRKESCCTLESPIIPPFLTDYDVKAIKRNVPMEENLFMTKTSSPDGMVRSVRFKNRKCIFFQKGRCQIYNWRPLDCRLFPVDVHFERGNFFWIVYDFCQLSENELGKLLSYARSEILPLFRDKQELMQYYKYGINMELYKNNRWRRLKAL